MSWMLKSETSLRMMKVLESRKRSDHVLIFSFLRNKSKESEV